MSNVPFDAPIAPTEFIGRAEAVRKITGRLNDASFSSTSVVGGPMTGKASLLRYLASDSADACLENAPHLLRIYIDVEGLSAGGTPFDFWTTVLRQMRLQSTVDEGLINPFIAKAEAQKLSMYNLEDLFDALNAKGLRLALLVNHWESILKNLSFWPPANNFLHLVRYFGQGAPKRTVAWVVASERPLLDLWDSTRGASPYYNIFETVPLGVLTDAEVKEFTQAAFKRAQVKLDPAIAKFVEEASGGHPFLVSFLANRCLELSRDNGHVAIDEVLVRMSDANGPLVSLIQQIRGSMTGLERQLFDKSTVAPDSLTEKQKRQLSDLNMYGLVPPRPRL